MPPDAQLGGSFKKKEMKEKITLKELITPLENGSIPFVELIRAAGTHVGDIGKRKYNSWTIEHDGKEHFNISNNKYSEKSFSLWEANGDIDTYQDYYGEGAELTTTNNQAQIYRMYKALGIDLPQTENEQLEISIIEDLKK